jgi:3-oxocholest-4-en-26-oate---CoA ligase
MDHPLTFNLADLFESVAAVVPDAEALVVGDRRLSYAALDERAGRLAGRLAEAGVGPGNFVGLQLINGTEYLEGMLACFKLRAVPVNVNYRYVGEELRHLYADAGLVGLVHHRSFAGDIGSALDAMEERRVLLDVADGSGIEPVPGAEDYEAALSDADAPPRSDDRSGDDLYCVYTGGTTGLPKGVLWRHEDIFFAAMGGGDTMRLGMVVDRPDQLAERVLQPGLVALAAPPLMHASAHWLAFSMLFGGGKVVLEPDGHFVPERILRLVEAERVNILVIVGDAMAVPLLDELEALRRTNGAPDLSSLMAVGSGGALLSRSTKQRLAALVPDAMVVDAFGSSETGQIGGNQSEDDPYGTPRLRVDDRTAVLDDEHRFVEQGSGVVGRLARGGRVPLGYHRDPGKTATTFVEADGRRWAIPGDLATVEEDGSIVVLGRESQCINTGGEKVYPEEVEAALKEHPGVADVVVVGDPDDVWGERVTAVVATRPGKRLSLDLCRDHLRGRIASYKIPKQLVLVDAIERSPSGKADYRWAKAQLPSSGAARPDTVI